MDKRTEVLLQNSVEDLCLAIRFSVIRCTHVESSTTQAKKFAPKLTNEDRVVVKYKTVWYVMIFADNIKKKLGHLRSRILSW